MRLIGPQGQSVEVADNNAFMRAYYTSEGYQPEGSELSHAAADAAASAADLEQATDEPPTEVARPLPGSGGDPSANPSD